MMNQVNVDKFVVVCVPGWGWSRRETEGGELQQVLDIPTQMQFDRALAVVSNDRIEYFQAILPPEMSVFGQKMLLRPIEDELPRFSERALSRALLIFGTELIAHSNEDIVLRFQSRERLFELPETRGYASHATFL